MKEVLDIYERIEKTRVEFENSEERDLGWEFYDFFVSYWSKESGNPYSRRHYSIEEIDRAFDNLED